MKFKNAFMDEIPIQYREKVIEKVRLFEQHLLSNVDIHKMPKGFWIRKIKNTEIFKFRVNRGDRILFKIINNEVIYLHYCNHDEQINKGKNMNASIIGDNNTYELSIDDSEYNEDEWDGEINEYITNEVYSALQEMKNKHIAEDDEIRLSIELNDLNEFHYLSKNQYECIKETKKNVLVHGCAGSGKTNIAVSKLKLNDKLNIKTCYITDSNLLSDKVKKLFNHNEEAEENIYICTYKDICVDLMQAQSDVTFIEYEGFYEWIKHSGILDKQNMSLTVRELWVEINSKIKGKDIKRKIIDIDTYMIDRSSCYDEKIKKQIYDIAKEYKLWLQLNKFYDKNDLSYEAYKNIKDENKYDYIIYDESQELTEKQIMLIKSLCNNEYGLLMLGDINQATNVSNVNYNMLKNILIKNSKMLSYNLLLKDYRSGSGTVCFVNEILRLKQKKFKNYGSEFTIEIQPIQRGIKPNILYVLSKKQEFFSKSSRMIDGAVVVSEKEDRETLIKQGFDSSRIFTIEEIRGLEYENIYCYNIMSKFKTMWDSLLLEENKKIDLMYSIYFNLLYIASTRASKKLFFIEDEKTELNKYVDKYLNLISDEQLLIDSINISLSKEEWENEAERLEKGGQYHLACKAYKNAGNMVRADICSKVYNKEVNYKNFNDNSSIIEIKGDYINRSIIEKVLYKIFEEYDIYMEGFIHIIRYDYTINANTSVTKYAETKDDIFKLSEIIADEFKSKDFDKSYIYICGSYYRENKLVDLSGIFKNNNLDLKVNIAGDNIITEEYKCINREYYLNNFKEYINKDWVKIEENEAKYKDKTAEDILDFIFN